MDGMASSKITIFYISTILLSIHNIITKKGEYEIKELPCQLLLLFQIMIMQFLIILRKTKDQRKIILEVYLVQKLSSICFCPWILTECRA